MVEPAGCDLCGLPLPPLPVRVVIGGSERQFCCDGCARVYRIADERGMLAQVLAPAAPPPVPAEAPANTASATFAIDGMWCAGCAVAAEQIVGRTAGVARVEISFAAERGRITYDAARIAPAAALQPLAALGYRTRLTTDGAAASPGRTLLPVLLQLFAAVVFGMPVMDFSVQFLYPHYLAGQSDTPELRAVTLQVALLAAATLFIGGQSFLRGAWRALRARTATMDTLVALGTLAAFGYSTAAAIAGGAVYFDSVAMITAFVMFGRLLEAAGGAEARKGIRRLLELQPQRALRLHGGAWQEVESASLAPGDTVRVLAGQRVPADLLIDTDDVELDESLLTGESLPAPRGPGDSALAGTLVARGVVQGRVMRAARETRLAQITRQVERTLAAKPPLQRMADRASAWFTLAILAASAVTFAGWLIAGRAPGDAVLAAVAVLVVACPCALGLATPFALSVTLGQAARAGVLVRNPSAIEAAAAIQRIVFDKTGTLTRGQLSVAQVGVNADARLNADGLLARAAAVEQYAEHPLARAITAAYVGPPVHADGFQFTPGFGASAQVDGERVLVGSAPYVGVRDDEPLIADAGQAAAHGKSIVWVGSGGRALGYIALGDTLNPTTAAALRQLDAARLRTVLLSGDSAPTVRTIASALGLREYEASCTPSAKQARIRAWQAAGERVAMAGDGANDAPALAQADLAITVAGGTAAAGETSDLLLMRPDLTLIPAFLALARRTRRIIRQNLLWAFAYNAVALPLAMLGLINPVIASAAMAASSVLVVANSLRLGR